MSTVNQLTHMLAIYMEQPPKVQQMTWPKSTGQCNNQDMQRTTVVLSARIINNKNTVFAQIIHTFESGQIHFILFLK